MNARKQVKKVAINLFRKRKTKDSIKENLLHNNSPNLFKNRIIKLKL